MSQDGELTETATALPDEAIIWAFRLLIGRDPVDQDEIERHRHVADLERLRVAFANTWEFQDFFDRVGFGRPHYRMPMFLMRPPSNPAIPWRFAPPDLENPVCQFCTTAQFRDPAHAEIVEAMGLKPEATRRQWEMVWIVSVLATAGLIAPGRRICGLDVAQSRIPALLASRGVEVLVADKIRPDADIKRRRGLRSSQLFHPEIVNLDDFERLIRWEMLDIEAMPAAFDDMFDAIWSASVIDHLGPLTRMLAILRDTLRPLKPGGLSMHTLAFNISSDGVTVNNPDFAVLRRQDVERLALALHAEGHRIEALNFHPGLDPEDDELLSSPGSKPRPKQRHGAHVVTSFGLVIRKKG